MAKIQVTGEVRDRFVGAMLSELAVATGMQLVDLAQSGLWERTKAAVPDPLWVEEDKLREAVEYKAPTKCSVCAKVDVPEPGDMCPGCRDAFEQANDPRLRKAWDDVNTTMKAEAWQNGLPEAVERMREHLHGNAPIKFDARDRMALAYILARVGR